MEPNNFVVDNSMLSTFRACIRKGFYRYEKGFTLPMVAAPLNFGGAIHAGIAHFLRTGSKDDSLAIALKSMRAQEWDEREWRTPQRVVDVLTKVFDEPLPKPLLAPNGEPIVEADFVWPLCDREELLCTQPLQHIMQRNGFDNVLYAGIVDMLGDWDGREMVVDHKTTSLLVGDKRKGESKSISPIWWDSFRPHGAVPMYCWGASKILGRRIRAVMINGIGVNATDVCLGRHIFEITPEEIEEARQRVILEVTQILTLKSQGLLEVSFNPDSCFSYGKSCPFIQMCRTTKTSRPQLESLYTVDRWNPLEARKKEAAEIAE